MQSMGLFLINVLKNKFIFLDWRESSQGIMSRRFTKRYLTEADDYQCPLSEETQKIAEDELRETTHSRTQALTSLRGWLEQNPKINAVRMGKSETNVPLTNDHGQSNF